MANNKFEPAENELSNIEIRLECLRLATEFSPENDRRNPLPVADEYYNWVMKTISKKTTRKEPSKKKV